MRELSVTLRVEYLKIRRSKVFNITILIFVIIPMMTGLLMFISQNPEIAAKLGIIGTKAKLFDENDWSGYFSLICQSMASLGFIGFGFVTTWVFGREYIDRTMKDLLALPVSRSSIVSAKFIISFFWCILLSFVIYFVGIAFGYLIHIPGWKEGMLSQFSTTFWGVALLTFLLNPILAFLACFSRGIIAPIGFMIVALIMANFLGVLGLGPYFPWAVPGLFAVADDTAGMKLLPVSYVILGLTFVGGWWATMRWWYRADHH